MMAASASGLSITRCEPNLRWRSSVTRKTRVHPDVLAEDHDVRVPLHLLEEREVQRLDMLSFVMSSPPREPLAAHRRGARRRRRLLRPGRGALAEPAGELLALRAEVRRQLGVHVVEHRQRIGGGVASKRRTASDISSSTRSSRPSSRRPFCRM